MPEDKPRETVPVAEEQVRVERVEADTARVRLDKTVEHEPVEIEVPLLAEELAIDRVAVGRVVDEPVGPRTEGDVTIVPVYAERVVTHKQLVLVEEIRVRRVRKEETHRQRVDRRVERLEVSRRESNEPNRPEKDGGEGP